MSGKRGNKPVNVNGARQSSSDASRGADASRADAASQQNSGASESESTDSMLMKIWSKLTKLDTIEAQVAKIDRIEEDIKTIGGRVFILQGENNKLKQENADLQKRVKDLEESHTFNSDVVRDLQRDKADTSGLASQDERITILESRLVDYNNRMRRNNIVIHNLPENYEKSYMGGSLNPEAVVLSTGDSGLNEDGSDAMEGAAVTDAEATESDGASAGGAEAKESTGAPPRPHFSMERFVESFIRKELGIDVQIDAAHRTNGAHFDKSKPRLIHARCLRREDRDKILRAAPSSLKTRKFKGNSVYFTDDIDPSTREVHKSLLIKMKEMRSQGYFAYIPWTVPRVIKYKQGSKDSQLPLRTYRY